MTLSASAATTDKATTAWRRLSFRSIHCPLIPYDRATAFSSGEGNAQGHRPLSTYPLVLLSLPRVPPAGELTASGLCELRNTYHTNCCAGLIAVHPVWAGDAVPGLSKGGVLDQRRAVHGDSVHGRWPARPEYRARLATGRSRERWHRPDGKPRRCRLRQQPRRRGPGRRARRSHLVCGAERCRWKDDSLCLSRIRRSSATTWSGWR